MLVPAMTRDDERAYVRSCVEAGRLLEQQRWHELASLDEACALEAADALIAAALMVPLPASRREWSGLVEQPRVFYRTRS